MLLPISDEKPSDPGMAWASKLLIAVNVAVWFVTGFAVDLPREGLGGIPQDVALQWGFVPASPSLATAFTAMFLHADLMHLAGNMWFLYLFSDNVELRMGGGKFLVCYLLAGLGGTMGHALFFPDSAIPSIGASGAIYGVMGMYFFLFPYNRVRFLYFFFFIGTFYTSALFAIGYFFITEAVIGYFTAHAGIGTGVGHLAHAGGFVVGFILVQGLTAWGFVRDDGWTLFAWLKGKRRPAAAPDDHHDGAPAGPGSAYVRPEPAKAEVVAALVNAERMEEARRLWRREAFSDHALVLPPREQLELALYLDKSGDGGSARDAYERIIKHYSGQQPFEAEAHLALAGMLLAQIRGTGERGDLGEIARHLRLAISQHPVPARRGLAEQWLAAVDNLA
ncbi:MAG: rhomboid family intramembrane serine protease [Planctomycetes bacterium]|nr:rhomboid family intramembrane serine protease [Planctomycetota bacterium]